MASSSRSTSHEIEELSWRMNIDMDKDGLVIADSDLEVQTEDLGGAW